MPSSDHSILDSKELKFLNSHDVCRLAVASSDGMPLVTPVLYAMEGQHPIIATDYGTKKIRILRQNNKVSLVVDDYEPNRALVLQGFCEIHERGKDYLRLLQVLFNRFEYYRNNSWGEGESPILEITPLKIVSWGI